jgi:hypothetical protein
VKAKTTVYKGRYTPRKIQTKVVELRRQEKAERKLDEAKAQNNLTD